MEIESKSLSERFNYIVPQIRLTLVREASVQPYFVHSPMDVEKIIEPLKYYSEEHFVAFHLNTQNQVLGYQIVAQGTVSESLIHPREVFKAAILDNSVAILVAHNHPGGSLEPSACDLVCTQQLIKVGQLLGIPLLDHVIVSSNGIHSMREKRQDLWTANSGGVEVQYEEANAPAVVHKAESFWSAFELEKDLPKLLGSVDEVIQAESIRRRQLPDLITLRDLIANKTESAMNQATDSEKEMLRSFGSLGLNCINEIINRDQVEDWVQTSSARYDWELLQQACIELWKERERISKTYSKERYQKVLKAYFGNQSMAESPSTNVSNDQDSQPEIAA